MYMIKTLHWQFRSIYFLCLSLSLHECEPQGGYRKGHETTHVITYALNCTALQCIALWCITALYCTTPHDTALKCMPCV